MSPGDDFNNKIFSCNPNRRDFVIKSFKSFKKLFLYLAHETNLLEIKNVFKE